MARTPVPMTAASRKAAGRLVTSLAHLVPVDSFVFRRAWRPRKPGIGQRLNRLPAMPSRAGTRVSRQDADADLAGGDQPHGGQEGDPDDGEPGERDHHGGAGEHDGTTSGSHGHAGGLVGIHALRQVLLVADRDEQRVVDTDREPDHQPQDGGGAGELDYRRQGQCAGHADPDPDQGGEQRQSGRDHGAERDGEHEHRDQDADGLRCALFGHGLGRLATELDLESGRLGRLGRRDEVLLHRRGELVELRVIADRGVGDGPVRGHCLRLEGITDHADHLGRGGTCQRLLDGRLQLRVRHLGTIRGREDDASSGAARSGLGEPLLQQLRSSHRLDAGDRQLGISVLAERASQAGDGDEHEHPRRQHQPAALEREASDAIEEGSHLSRLLKSRVSRSDRPASRDCQVHLPLVKLGTGRPASAMLAVWKVIAFTLVKGIGLLSDCKSL